MLQNMRSWHDFHITGYAFDGKRKELSFDIEWPYQTPTDVERAKISLLGVEAYFLEHDLGVNVISSFSERPLREFLEEWERRFETECKWGWPKFWRPVRHPPRPVAVELEDALQRLTALEVKCIELSSSYGLSGWILAVGIQAEVVEI
jgi:hypothetical protein